MASTQKVTRVTVLVENSADRPCLPFGARVISFMCVSLVYRLLTTVLASLVLLARSSASKDIEILALRQGAPRGAVEPSGGERTPSPVCRSRLVKLGAVVRREVARDE